MTLLLALDTETTEPDAGATITCRRCSGPGPFYKGERVCKRCRYQQRRDREEATPEQRERRLEQGRQWATAAHRRRRARVLAHYGGRCACCGDDHEAFLAIDHIGGGGNAHRRALGGGPMIGSTSFYRWIIDNGFPDGFRVLCHNCNFAIGHYGSCPHDTDPRP